MMLYGPRGILNLARTRERKDGERGQILVLFTLVIVLLMVLAAVVIDAGLLRTDRARLQNALDAGALAAARSLPATSANVDAVEATAISYAGANFPGLGTPDITFRCIIGADPTTGLPRMIDMPAVCNVPLAVDSPSWVCTAAVCWAPCDPRAGRFVQHHRPDGFRDPQLHLRPCGGDQQRQHRRHAGRRVHRALRARSRPSTWC